MDADISQPATGDAGPGPGAAQEAPPQQDLHRPLLRVDRTMGAEARRHILIPVDDTDDSEVALRWAISALYRPGDTFHLLNVVPEPAMVHVWAGIYIPPEEDAELQEIETTKDFVKHRFAEMLVAAQVPFVLHIFLGSTDSEAVAKVVAKKAADLDAKIVVVARHSKGRIKEMWVGSVTKALLKLAPVPLAIVPHT